MFSFFSGNPEFVEEAQPANDVIEEENVDWKKLLKEKDAEMEKLKKSLAEAEKQFRIQTQVKKETILTLHAYSQTSSTKSRSCLK